MHILLLPVISHIGKAAIGTCILQVEEQPFAFVTVTLTAKVPAAPAFTVIWLELCPAVIVPPVTVQA
jgi:hypothetical protein